MFVFLVATAAAALPSAPRRFQQAPPASAPRGVAVADRPKAVPRRGSDVAPRGGGGGGDDEADAVAPKLTGEDATTSAPSQPLTPSPAGSPRLVSTPAAASGRSPRMASLMQTKLATYASRASCWADPECARRFGPRAEPRGPAECTSSGTAGGEFACSGVNLLAQVPLGALGSDTSNGGEGSDMWGWTAPDGTRFAIVGCTDGTSVVDVTDPTAPRVSGWLPSASPEVSYWRDVKVYAGKAYIVSEGDGHGLQILDLTTVSPGGVEPGSGPPQTLTATSSYDGVSTCHNIAVNEATGRAYLMGCKEPDGETFSCDGGLHILDLTTPEPTFLGCFGADGYVHDAECVTYTGPDASKVGAELCFCCNEDALTIVDVSSAAAPAIVVSRSTYSGSSFVHQGSLTGDMAFFILGDEGDESDAGGPTRTFVFDVSTLASPQLVSVWNAPTTAIDHNLYVVDDVVVQTNYRAGLRILDTSALGVTGTLGPELAYFESYPVDGVGFNGMWSSFTFGGKLGTIATSDIEGGLFLFQMDLSGGQAPESDVAVTPSSPTGPCEASGWSEWSECTSSRAWPRAAVLAEPKLAQCSGSGCAYDRVADKAFRIEKRKQRASAPRRMEPRVVAKRGCAVEQRSAATVERLAITRLDNPPPPEFRSLRFEIPVVFHVISSSIEPASEITEEQIFDQMDVLNRAFEGKQVATVQDRVPTGVSFALREIVRKEDDDQFKNCFDDYLEIAASDNVDTATVMNVYSCAPSGGLLGWTRFPDEAPEDDPMHAVWLNYRTIPGVENGVAPYDLGDTLVHEAGHYLGLPHTFDGESCDGPGDGIDDTPQQKSPTFGTCAANEGADTCPDLPGLDPIRNLMNYAEDSCMDRFTSDQAEAMHDALYLYLPSMQSNAPTCTGTRRRSRSATAGDCSGEILLEAECCDTADRTVTVLSTPKNSPPPAFAPDSFG